MKLIYYDIHFYKHSTKPVVVKKATLIPATTFEMERNII